VGDESGVRGLHAQASSAAPAGPIVPPFFFAADPGGCFIAVREQDATCVNGA
jgi:hypothetical protein